MRRRDVQLSSWSVDPKRDPTREPPRPPCLRHEDYEDQFDFTTVFYDVFWSPAGDEIICLGPPLFNLEQDLDLTIVAWPSMVRCAYAIRHLFLGCRVVAKPPAGTTGLILKTRGGESFLAPQPNLCEMFRGRRVAVTLSRNNELAWIRDWISFNKGYHRCDAVLIYDNNSDRYGINDIYDYVEPVADGVRVLILSWPFKYGVPDWRLPLSYGLVDSLYCQPGMLDHARWRFLSHASSVLNTDIDELVITERHRSIFELVEESATGLLVFGGVWVENHPGPSGRAGRPPRHRDFALVGTTDRIGCEPKWAVVPARVPQAGQWHIHRVLGMSPSECLQDVGLRHFKAINTDWTVDRNRSPERRTAAIPLDPGSLRVDLELQEALSKVFSEGPSLIPATERSPPPWFIRAHVVGRLAAETETPGAVPTASAPTSPRRSLRRILARLREGTKRYGTASRARADAARLRDPWYHVQRGRWLQDEGDPVAAHGAFARAIELDPKFTVAYHDMARNEFHCGLRGRPGKAADILRACAQRVTEDGLTRALLAKELERKGRLYDAVVEIEVATALEPDNPHYHCLHARILRRLGRLDAAERAARRGITFDDLPARMQAFGRQSVVTIWRDYQWRAPTAHDLRAELAEILASKGDRPAAEAAARRALACARTDPECHHRLSEILAIRGRHDEAVATLEAAIALAEQDMRRPTPRDWPLTQRNGHIEAGARRLSRILHAAGRVDEAILVLRNALARVPGSGAITDQLAVFLAERGVDREAAALLQTAIRDRPEDARLRYRLSKVLQATDGLEAIAQAEIAAKLEPDTPLFQDHLVKLLLAAERTDDAVRALARALPRNARHGPLYFELSRLLQRRGHRDGAVTAARRAVALEPRRLNWLDHLAVLLSEAGRPGEAEAFLRRALKRKAENGVLYFRLSRLLRAARRLEEAVAAARRAVELEPEKPYLPEQLVALLIEAGHESDAEAALRDALEHHPGHAALHFHRSQLLQRRQRLEDAMAAARRAVELEPWRPRWREGLAALLIEADRPDEAEAALREAIEGKVESGGMYFRLSHLLQEQRPQEALAAARRAVEVEPQKPYLHERLAALLLRAGSEPEAEAVLRDALERHPGHAALHFHQSRLWQWRGRPAAALAAARRAVELEPERRRWQDHLSALLSEAGRRETTAGLGCGTDRAFLLAFPAARSGRGGDRGPDGTPDCPILPCHDGPEHRAAQRGPSTPNFSPDSA